MAGTQIAIPLDHVHRAGLSSAVVVAFAVASMMALVAAWGWIRAGATCLAVTTLGLVVERVGVTTGFPFGHYGYSGALLPQLGGVPVVVALAWFAMGAPAWAVAQRLGDWRGWGKVARVAVGAVALAAWDLFLDPQMTRERFWVWEEPGPVSFRGIPLTNFVGWVGVGVVVMIVFAFAGRVGRGPGRINPSLPLAGLYAWMAVMETIGFLVFFHDTIVGIVGGLVMLPIAAFALFGRPSGG